MAISKELTNAVAPLDALRTKEAELRESPATTQSELAEAQRLLPRFSVSMFRQSRRQSHAKAAQVGSAKRQEQRWLRHKSTLGKLKNAK